MAGDDLLIQIGADIGDADQKISKLSGRVDDLGGSMAQAESKGGGFFSKLAGGALIGGVGGLAVALGGAAMKGLEFNNSMEQTTAKLNAFTKDGKKSAEILEMIKDRAAQTPFAFEEMANAASGLLPAAKMAGKGLEDLIEQAEILAASNPAEGLEGAAFALREAVSGDFTSIIERFNLPRTYINQLKDEGVPALEIVGRAMAEMGYDTELVSNMANTAQGRWSTFLDTLVGVAAQATAPIFDVLSAGLASVNEWLTANQPAIQAFATSLAQGLGQAMQFVGQVIQTVGPIVVGTIQTIGLVLGPVIGFIQQFAGALQAGKDPLEAFGTLVGQVGGHVMELGGKVLTAVMEALPGIISKLGEWGLAFIQWIGPKIPPMLAELGKLLMQLGGWLLGTALPTIIGKLAEWGGALIAWIAPRIPPLLLELGKLLLKLGGWIVTEALPAIIQKLGEWGAAFLNWVAKDVLPFIGAKLAEIANALWAWISNTAKDVVTKVKEVGTGIVEGIRQGVKNAWDAFVAWLSGLVKDALPDFLKDWLGISSPSKVTAEMGRAMVDGLRVGAQSGTQALYKAWDGIMGGLTSGPLESALTVQGSGGAPTNIPGSGGAPSSRQQPVSVHVYLDSREISRSLATRQRIRVARGGA